MPRLYKRQMTKQLSMPSQRLELGELPTLQEEPPSKPPLHRKPLRTLPVFSMLWTPPPPTKGPRLHSGPPLSIYLKKVSEPKLPPD
jgi:hypothetical protein